jgi:aspartyl protease family protein
LRPAALLLVSTLLCGSTWAQTVSMSGRLGDNKALLMIDGQPRTLAVGATAQGVKLVSLSAEAAVVEVAGQRSTLRIGESQVNVGGVASPGGGTRIVMPADAGGHFVSEGSINGRAVRFMVDTGATVVSLSASEARRIGLKYEDGRRGFVDTANGQSAAYVVKLASMRIGDVQVFDVDAVVVPMDMSFVLLGNCFLTRFQMKRENDLLTLDKRY